MGCASPNVMALAKMVVAVTNAPAKRASMRFSQLQWGKPISILRISEAPLVRRSGGSDPGLGVVVLRCVRHGLGFCLGFLDPRLAQRRRELAPFAARLDVGRIITGHRPEQPVLGTMGIDPVPDLRHLGTLGGSYVDRLTVTIAAGPPAAAMQRIAAARLDA